MVESNKHTIIIMVGLPKSGKSTYVDKYFYQLQILCPDDIRRALGQTFDIRLEPLVWAVHDTMLRAHMERGNSICVDATNTKESTLVKYKELASTYSYNVVHYIMGTPYEVCMERNKKLEGTSDFVPAWVMETMNEQLQHILCSSFLMLGDLVHVPYRKED